MKNKRLTKIFSLITIIVLLCLFVFSGCKQENTYYQIPEYVSSKTEEEHYTEICRRAETILCEKDYLPKEGGYAVEMVYNFSEQPQFFAVVYFNGNGYLGAIINDDYYKVQQIYDVSTSADFWKDIGNNQSKKYYDGEKYYRINDDFYDLQGNLLDQQAIETKKTENQKIELKGYYRLEIVPKFRGVFGDCYRYVLPEDNSQLTDIQHKENIKVRAQKKLDQLNSEGRGYLSVTVEIMKSFNEKYKYFLVTYVSSKSTFRGNKQPHVYDLGIILNDQYYYLNTTRITSDKTFFDQHEVLNQEKYFGIMGNFHLNSSMAETLLVVAVKKDGKFYRLKFDGLSYLPEEDTSNLNKQVFLAEGVYNSTLIDTLDVYLKEFID